ncbi:adenosylcobinamide-GDP ribazoletransferase [Octadecabacter sp. G9-8]|uniref:Adenosylcobinamide-GDP ribazoletransferase n=1 Tax=Octadecabacter dasysiphoniae TaxID=2909341 RepID=A0ABS9CTR5_9RHOB|nr:adenosylcobinamide-GDP ribazoletransferase [Octadecabacter dasysiphoniae]MCF2870157.1 adenosylcobinamide-GDP ribazoletransferase [Octadecabacter dasysiphoniae]
MKDNRDNSSLMVLSDVPAALGLLSRLPVRVDTQRATARGAKAAWAYPLAGLILALIACAVGQIALWAGLTPALTAGLVLATLVIITGAMHEDGLADAADGLWGGWDTARRLAIMKDSSIGAYGVIALTLGLGLRWHALTLAIDHNLLWHAVIAAAMLSRAVMVPIMARLPHARDTGLSHSVGRPGKTPARIAEGTAIIATLIMFQLGGLWLIAAALLTATACALIAKAKIGGQTGDILGATQQVSEIAILLTLTATLI